MCSSRSGQHFELRQIRERRLAIGPAHLFARCEPSTNAGTLRAFKDGAAEVFRQVRAADAGRFARRHPGYRRRNGEGDAARSAAGTASDGHHGQTHRHDLVSLGRSGCTRLANHGCAQAATAGATPRARPAPSSSGVAAIGPRAPWRGQRNSDVGFARLAGLQAGGIWCELAGCPQHVSRSFGSASGLLNW